MILFPFIIDENLDISSGNRLLGGLSRDLLLLIIVSEYSSWNLLCHYILNNFRINLAS